MKYRRLGRTGLLVSEIALGTVEIGMEYGLGEAGRSRRPPEREAIYLVHAALEMGINLIDTAPAYGDSESIIGRALRDRPGKCLIATKCTVRQPGEETSASLAHRIERSVEESLRRLGVDALDLVQIHNATAHDLTQTDALHALERLQAQGKIRWIGATTYGEEAPLAALTRKSVSVLQVPFHLLNQSMAERLFPVALESDAGILARSVLAKGALTGREHLLPEDLAALREHIRNLRTRLGEQRLAELAIRFALSQPAISSILVGTGNPGHLASAIAAASIGPLSGEELAVARAAAWDPSEADTTRW